MESDKGIQARDRVRILGKDNRKHFSARIEMR